MKPLQFFVAFAAIAIMVGIAAYRMQEDRKAVVPQLAHPPIRVAEPIDDDPTMLTVPEPPDWVWIEGDDELLDDDGEHAEMLFSEPRSACWRKTRAEYLAAHPQCEFKGCKEKKNLQVHHCKPFHLFPELECVQSNLISACWNHHLWGCHRGNFKDYDPQVRSNFASGRYTILGWERLKANREKHRKLKEREKVALLAI